MRGMSLSHCAGAGVCPPEVHCPTCVAARSGPRGRAIGTAQVPVRRFGIAPPPPEDVLYFEEEDDAGPGARTIGERGGRAVWAGALLAAALAGIVLYA